MPSTLTAPPTRRTTPGTPQPGAPAPRAGRTAAALGLVAVVATAGAGLRLAVPLLQHPGGQPATAAADPASPGLAVGQAIATSSGSLTVTSARLNNGLSAEELGGMSHGVSSLVSSGSAEVAVTLTINNDRTTPLALSPDQFTLVTGKGGTPTSTPQAVAGGTVQVGGSVPAHASVDARVAFVTKTDGSRLWLRYTDPGTAQVVRVPLGQAAKVAPAPAGGHAGHGMGGMPMPTDEHDHH